MTKTAAAEAFTAHVDALRAQHGPEALIVRPSVYRTPDGAEMAVGGWAFLDGDPALVPALLDVIVFTEGQPETDAGRRFADAMRVLSPYARRQVTPVDHYEVRVPEADRAAVRAALVALPDPSAANPASVAPVRTDPDAAERKINADIKAAEAPTPVKLAASVQGLSGVLAGLTGLQLVGARWAAEWVGAVPYALMGLGLASLAMAVSQYRARAWAGPGSVLLSGVVALTVIGWVLYTLTSVMSCMAYMSVPLSMLSAVLSLVALRGVRETAAARQRLSDEGLSLGL